MLVAPDTTAPAAPELLPYTPVWTDNPEVTLLTSLGTIVFELYPAASPVTVANWLAYVETDFFDGLIFHRVIDGFMVQGGGFNPGMITEAASYAPISLESNNGLSNLRGTIAMARTNLPNSATSQFFVNLVDNTFLDYNAATSTSGYAVFGSVIDGLSVVDAIADVTTQTVGAYDDVPVTDVVIQSASVTHTGTAYSQTGFIVPFGLETGATWTYSLDDGGSWLTGQVSGNGVPYLALPEGTYAPTDVIVRQTDAAQNSSQSMALAATLVVDKTAPTVALSANKTSLSGSETATITFTFSEDPGSSFTWDGTAGDVTVTGGTLGAISGTGLTRTAIFTPTANSTTNGVISMASGTFTDIAGNGNAEASNTLSLTVDTVPDTFAVTVEAKFWSGNAAIEGVGFAGFSTTTKTGAGGSVVLADQPAGNLTLTPSKTATTSDKSQVNLLDAIAILKSIVGLTSLNPNQRIAANFDGNTGVDLNDAIGILKHVVGLPSADPAWVFVDAADATPDPADPITVNVAADTTVALTGILVGDVDGSWGNT